MSQIIFERLLIPNLDLGEKTGKAIIKVRQILSLICKLFAQILGWNCVKGLRFTKIVEQIKFEGVWGKFEAP